MVSKCVVKMVHCEVLTITNMLRKEVGVKWTMQAKKSFELVKQALTQEPILISPNFTKDFYIFSFTSEHTIAVVLLQKNSLGQEQPISFFSKALEMPHSNIISWRSKPWHWLKH